MNLRDGFRDIVDGWMLIDSFDEITGRIERCAAWSKANGGLNPDESATISFMIEVQFARDQRDGIVP